MPILNPVGHQSTNWIVRFVFIVACLGSNTALLGHCYYSIIWTSSTIAALTSLGTTSPRKRRQQAMYFPWRGSHLYRCLSLDFKRFRHDSINVINVNSRPKKNTFLDHLVSWLETGFRHFSYSLRFVIDFLSWNYWCVSRQREMYSWVRNQIGLKLVQVNIEWTFKS